MVVECGLSCSTACGIFPDQGLNSVSPALAGRFFTTKLPGKPITKTIFEAKKKRKLIKASHRTGIYAHIYTLYKKEDWDGEPFLLD